MDSYQVDDEVIFDEGAKLQEEEERQDEVVPFPQTTPNPVFGMNQRGTEAEAGELDEEDDEEIELGPRARAALVETKSHHELFEDENPADDMLAHFAAKRQGRLVSADNIVQLVNAMDLGKLAPNAVRNLSTRPRSVTMYVAARMKADAGFKAAAENLIACAADKTVTGPNLAGKMEEFLVEVGSALRAHSYLAIMCLVELISRVRGLKNEGKAGFVRSAQVEEYCTQWCLTPARRLKKFYELAKEGLISDVKGSVGGSYGLQRLNVKNFELKQDLLDFVDGLIGYLSFEAVTSASAVDAVLAITVDEGDFTHSLRMTEEEEFKTFKARLKTRTEHAVDACMLHNQMWRYPCEEKMCLTLKNCCSVKLWTKCMAIMDADSIEFEFLSAEEAMELMERAQERIDVYTKNKKILPPRKAATPKQTTNQGTPAAASTPAAGQAAPARNGSGGTGTRVPFKDLMPGSIKRPCRFNADGKCHLGIMCPYQHVGMEVQQEEAAVKKQSEKIVAAQGKAAAQPAPPATGRGGIQIPKPNAKVVVMMSKSDSSGAEGEDFSVSSEPEDQMQWLYRVSGGRLGLPDAEVRSGKRTVEKTADGVKYSEDGFAVIGDKIDWDKLKEHDAEAVMDSSDGSGFSFRSVDLDSEGLSDDEEITEKRSKKVQQEMMAAAGREDFIKAGELKLELTRLRKGLAKAASERGVSEADCKMMKARAVSKQKSIMDMAKIVVDLAAVSEAGTVMLQNGSKGLSFPKVPARSVFSPEGDWKKLATEMTEWLEKLGTKVTRIRRFVMDGRVRLVAHVTSEVKADGMLWISLQEDMLSLHEDDKELLKVASVITEATKTSEILESAMADLMEEDNAMLLSELECPTTDAELLKMALEECETGSRTEVVAAGADRMCELWKEKHGLIERVNADDSSEFRIPENADTEVCLHPEMLCPKGFAVIDQVDNAWCGVCKAKVNMDVAHCCEVCGCQNKKSESSSEDIETTARLSDFREAL